jgi:hypothetical protein
MEEDVKVLKEVLLHMALSLTVMEEALETFLEETRVMQKVTLKAVRTVARSNDDGYVPPEA